MADNKYLRFALQLGSVLLAAAAAWLVLRYALRWLLPFGLALLTARLMEPLVQLLGELHLRRGVAAALCTVLLVGAAAGLCILAGAETVRFLKRLVEALPDYLGGLPRLLAGTEEKLRALSAAAAPELRQLLAGAVESLLEGAKALPAELSGVLLTTVSRCVSAAPSLLLFLLTYGISTFFIAASYPEVSRFLLRQFPDRLQARVRSIRTELFGLLGIWVRAQLLLMMVTFLELTAAFLLLRVQRPLTTALAVALVDALPVLGAGAVLLPWALLQLLAGEYAGAAGLAVTYGLVSLVRSCLEPKVLGARAGLHPAATLLAAYIGFCLLGVSGMVLFPLLLLLLKQLNDKGYVHLWK